ncbi:allantoicase-like [Aricia agestis]|uniref:allantoicase-like n=1 Tax=Aricia agestis TaxID=91739 RepID=UPI001C208902|nr:allantoicase-like [Aricia agestis]XP_041970930.1 allantoicase-like [Aricia agestis]
MIEKVVPAFAELSDFASAGAGGKVAFATDDFFATCENMISDSDPVFVADKYTEFGKWMDGWETRRKRIAGHDWCILKLATKCVIKGLLVDTAFFTGNYAPKYSIQAACLTPEEEALLPGRESRMGSACSECDLERVGRLNSDRWEEVVPVTTLQPGYEETRMNYQKVLSDEAFTHLRVNIYPDGGIARLRVYGEAKPEPPTCDQLVDLVSLLSGATCIEYSNAHYGHPRNIIKPAKSEGMYDGWETARRLDRPRVLEFTEDGTLKVTGDEWAVFELGFCGRATRIVVDTTHFKGNYPDSIKIEGCFSDKNRFDTKKAVWYNILKTSKLGPNKEHIFECNSDVVSHLRVTIAPDGGISRLRVFGHAEQMIM